MSFFESLLALVLASILLLQVSRRLSIPYPAMLATAGVVLALIPGTPSIALDPHIALALFIAPALVDAAYDFPVGAVWRLWRPLFALAVVAVLLTAGAVTWLGMAFAGLPFYAALALGAIVAPPDAAAATAVLGTVSMPRRSVAVLKGESLLNDALALLLFSAAISIQSHGGIDGGIALRLGLAAPGGILLGIALAWCSKRIQRYVSGTLGGNLLEFLTAFGVWIIAERLGLSPVLCLVAFAMTVARSAGLQTLARVRVHSFAVWETVVFLLNVLAFLLMGMQARRIVGGMPLDRLYEAAGFAGLVILCVILVRLIWVLIYNRLSNRFVSLRGEFKPATIRHGVLVGWCGMRGLITMATAFALPADFPQRDLIVLTAFAVVLATLVLQGLTLAPLVRLLRLDGEEGAQRELDKARTELAEAGLATLADRTGPAADYWRYTFETMRAAVAKPRDSVPFKERRKLGLLAVRRQRKRLEELRGAHEVDADAFIVLQEELDFHELALSTEDERHIEES
ncbi:cation:proton antiporter [Sphingomonas crusticola]|uniref:cation:proton antiporter n=1 Tax=Sphingomonas crusticola TaxID=1697973 RepID=UPI000E238F74|nr:cation:proton antiporter [Sphingomonas crusticola]